MIWSIIIVYLFDGAPIDFVRKKDASGATIRLWGSAILKPVLISGGHGVAGAAIARLLRQGNPGLPLVPGGRG
jgi:hypothetical protein